MGNKVLLVNKMDAVKAALYVFYQKRNALLIMAYAVLLNLVLS